MAAPTVSISLISRLAGWGTSTPFDVTTATGGIVGHSGADYYMNMGGGIAYYKFDGGQTIAETPFGTYSTGAYSGWWTPSGFGILMSDRTASDVVEYESATVSNNVISYDLDSASSNGIYYTQPADQKLREFYWYGERFGNGATLQISATLSDGTVATQTQAMGGEGNVSFKVTYRAREADSTIDIRITKTTAGDGSLGPVLVYRTIPTDPNRPRGLTREFMERYR